MTSPSSFLTVASSDRRVLQMPAVVVRHSVVLKTLLEHCHVDDPTKMSSRPLRLDAVDAATLERVFAWCEAADDTSRWTMLAELSQEHLFRLVQAADYLDISPLLRMACRRVAQLAAGQNPEQIRAYFGISDN